jgi:hypothetical protein
MWILFLTAPRTGTRVSGTLSEHSALKHHAINIYGGPGGIAPFILDLDTRWKLVISIMLPQLHSWQKCVLYSMDKMYGGPRASLHTVETNLVFAANQIPVFCL